jgi:hypothetical protein
LVDRELRIVTNRNRPQDGGEHAGEELIRWLRADQSRWRTVPLLMYCGLREPVAYLHKPKERVWVSTSPRTLQLFAEPSLKQLIEQTASRDDSDDEDDAASAPAAAPAPAAATTSKKKPSPKQKGTGGKTAPAKSKSSDGNPPPDAGSGSGSGSGPTVSSSIKRFFK